MHSSLSDYEGDAVYEAPSEQCLTAALELVINKVRYNAFKRHYESHISEKDGFCQTLPGQNFASFLAAFFKDNPDSKIYKHNVFRDLYLNRRNG